MLCKFKGCAKCKGDLVRDGDEWRCWQCGTYYYPSEPVMDLPLEVKESELVFHAADCDARSTRVRARRRTMTNINSVIMAKPESTEGGRRVSVLKRQEGAPVLLG